MGDPISGIMSGISGILGGIGATKSPTSKTSSQSTQSGVMDPQQTAIYGQLFNQIRQALKLGPSVRQSDRDTANAQINQQYGGAQQNAIANLTSMGFGDSGKVGSTIRSTDIARANAMQSSNATLQDQAYQRFADMMSRAQSFTTPRTFTSSGTSTSTGPSMSPFSAAGAGFGDLSSYLYLNSLNQPGGGGGGGGGGSYTGFPSICWIAIELYGENDWRVAVVRMWLIQKALSSRKWWLLVWGYALSGRLLASIIRRRRKRLRRALQALFDGIIWKAIEV